MGPVMMFMDLISGSRTGLGPRREAGVAGEARLLLRGVAREETVSCPMLRVPRFSTSLGFRRETHYESFLSNFQARLIQSLP